jgi:hypothetical protein
MLSFVCRTDGWYFYIRLEEYWCSASYEEAFLNDIELHRVVPLITSSNIDVFKRSYRGDAPALSRHFANDVELCRGVRSVVSMCSISCTEVSHQLYLSVPPAASTQGFAISYIQAFYQSYRGVPLTKGYSISCIPVFC